MMMKSRSSNSTLLPRKRSAAISIHQTTTRKRQNKGVINTTTTTTTTTTNTSDAIADARKRIKLGTARTTDHATVTAVDRVPLFDTQPVLFPKKAARIEILEKKRKDSEGTTTRTRQVDLIRVQRGKARRAARIAIQNVVKTVEFDTDNKRTMMDYFMLCQSGSSDHLSMDMSSTSPLDWIGLVRKDDDFVDSDDEEDIIRIQRENARRAARIAIQNVVKTVEFDVDNRQAMIDFFKLCQSGASPLSVLDKTSTSPLECISLVRKGGDYVDRDLILNGDYEEGEIIP